MGAVSFSLSFIWKRIGYVRCQTPIPEELEIHSTPGRKDVLLGAHELWGVQHRSKPRALKLSHISMATVLSFPIPPSIGANNNDNSRHQFCCFLFSRHYTESFTYISSFQTSYHPLEGDTIPSPTPNAHFTDKETEIYSMKYPAAITL